MNIFFRLFLDLLKAYIKKQGFTELYEVASIFKMSPQRLIKYVLTKNDKLKRIFDKANIPLKYINKINDGLLPSSYYNKIKGQLKSNIKSFIKGKDLNLYERTDEPNFDSPYDFAILSSSWIISGAWSGGYGNKRGILTLDFKGAKHSYTYFNVSIEVWEAMKAARGRNGTGAGSVFWKKYLIGNGPSGVWKRYSAIEYDKAISLREKTEKHIKSYKTYMKMKKRFQEKRVRIGKGISEYKSIIETRKKIYKHRQIYLRHELYRAKKSTRRK